MICQCRGAIIDIPTLKKHVVFLAKAGIKPLLAGTMGEGIHLSNSDRIALIKATREALDEIGFTGVPIIVGTGAGSTRETIQLSKSAAEAGADYVIVITPGYFAGALAGNRVALKAFFTEVAEKSPIPVIIYNCGFIPGCCKSSQSADDLTLVPGASGGIDLDSDLILEIAKGSPNTVGVKLTYVEFHRGPGNLWVRADFTLGVETLESKRGSARLFLIPPLCRISPGVFPLPMFLSSS